MDIKQLRPISPEEHPVSLRRYLLPTESIDYIYAMVTKVINRKDTGLVVYGNPRYGKTRSILYCEKMLKVEFPDMPVRVFSLPKELNASEGKFFSLFLSAVQHAETGGTIADKRIRLANHIIGAGSETPRRVFVLFIDEAQKLGEIHYEWLRDIYDQAELKGVTLLVVLVGQLELHAQKRTYVERKRPADIAIVSRFMIFEMRYRGIRSFEDFATCLDCYDTFVYPANSGWTFTKFFMPTAFESGFRLKTCARVLWDTFKELSDGLQITSEFEIPMKYFTKSIEILLCEHPECDVTNFALTSGTCKQVITESWYLSSMDDFRDMGVV